LTPSFGRLRLSFGANIPSAIAGRSRRRRNREGTEGGGEKEVSNF